MDQNLKDATSSQAAATSSCESGDANKPNTERQHLATDEKKQSATPPNKNSPFLTQHHQPLPTTNIVRPFGYNSMECGYCKGARAHIVASAAASGEENEKEDQDTPTPSSSPSKSSKSYGLMVDSMTPALYEAFLCQGWRRSGTHLYKPCNQESCCPAITIRLPVEKFQPTKSQQRLQTKLQRLLEPNNTKQSNQKKKHKSLSNPHSSPHNNKQHHQQHPRKRKQRTSSASSPKSNNTNSTSQSSHSEASATADVSALMNVVVSSEDNEASSTTCSNHQQQQSRGKSTPPILVALQVHIERCLSSHVSLPSTSKTQQHNSRLGKVVWKATAQSKRKSSRQQETLHRVYRTNICAQLAGVLRLDRHILLQHVMSTLNDNMLIDIKNKNSDDSMSLLKVEPHFPSGQLVVTLQLLQQPQSVQDDCTSTTTPSTTMWELNVESLPATSPSAARTRQTTTSTSTGNRREGKPSLWRVPPNPLSTPPLDKLSQWMQAHHKPAPTKEDDNVAKNGVARSFDIVTHSAYDSALFPEVHQLYARYQHVVHQDADPFAIAKARTKANDHDANPRDVGLTSGGNVDLHPDSDGPTRTAGLPLQKERLALKTLVQGLNWGTNAPFNFSERVSSMLMQYLEPYLQLTKHNNGVHHDTGRRKHKKWGNVDKVVSTVLQHYYSFYQFLVESPFDCPTEAEPIGVPMKNRPAGDQPTECGTYHQHYRVEGILVAVGVLDVLPTGISSVYLMYDPGFAHELIALGKLAILKEVEYSRSIKRSFYYLGYYIESCPKMRYKGEYHPSQYLCPETYQWVVEKVALPKLKDSGHHGFCRLADEEEDRDRISMIPQPNNPSKTALAWTQEIPTLCNSLRMIPMDIGANMTITYDMLQPNGQRMVCSILTEFVKEVGVDLGKQCLLKLS